MLNIFQSKKLEVSQETLNALTSNPFKMHSFFRYCRSEYAPENFCLYYLLHAYKKNPKKRMANFIIDNYTKGDYDGNDQYGNFAPQMNIKADVQSKFIPVKNKQGAILSDPRPALKAQYGHIPMKFSDKMDAHGFIGAMKMKLDGSTKPNAELFDELYDGVATNLLDSLSRFILVQSSGAPDGGPELIAFRKDIRICGWNPEALGIWN